MVTDYDCWHPGHDNVNVETIIEVLLDNADRARSLIKTVAPQMRNRPARCPSGDERALESALITEPDARDPDVVKMLDAVAGRLFV
jgi:5'-methylthioadenosine phosphorylase